MLVYAGAYALRNRVTDPICRKYFFPALTIKIIGAVALGVVYQFYYRGGDTFAFHTHGSRHVWEAFMDSPVKGFKLFFSDGTYGPGLWEYSEKIWYFRDQKSFFIIRIASVFDLITFSSYSATAVLFSVLSFTGGWLLFLTFYKKHPHLHRWLAVSCLFVPSVVFWGSGVLKDTVTLAFLGMATYCVQSLFIERKFHAGYMVLLLFSLYVIYSVKIYIVMSFLVAMLIWIFSHYFLKIQSTMLRILAVPFVVTACALLSYVAINKVVEDEPRYSLNKLAETARITAYDIHFWTGKDAGSGYTLGELDGSFGSILKLAPAAINVSLFRPYLWEVNNPLMVLAGLEGFVTLLITLYVIVKTRNKLFRCMQSPEVVFCLTFALVFAFGVGVSTYNFGSLTRYKIPLLPYYFVALTLMLDYARRTVKVTAANFSVS
jgi:hypothetical protein